MLRCVLLRAKYFVLFFSLFLEFRVYALIFLSKGINDLNLKMFIH
jgi:hypothetical protein